MTGSPDDWCAEDVASVDYVDGCKRQTTSQWQEYVKSEPYLSTWDSETLESTQACSAYRLASSPGNYFAIKSGVELKVWTGYLAYDSETEYNSGNWSYWGYNEAAIMMTFVDPAGAATLAAGVATFAAALAF